MVSVSAKFGESQYRPILGDQKPKLLTIMAQIKPMALIESMKKKVCMHSDVYFRTNKKTGKVYTGKLCNPSTKEPSAAQTAAKARFAKVSAAVRAILAGTSTSASAINR